jgi:serine/threonine protein kinase/tetratricopeptide (TPR) repeat protein
MNPCPSIEQLRNLLAEQLPDAEREWMESHVESCADCKQRLEELSGTLVLKGMLPERHPDSWSHHDPGSDFLERLRETPAPLAAQGGAADTLPDGGPTPVAKTAENWPQVPGYEILGLLGHGGMGVVYKARQISLNRVVALKMIRAGEHAPPELLARFRNEASAVARLHHPNIVQVYEVGEQGGLPYFSLEFVEGGSLAEKLAGVPLPPRKAAELAQTLARAIHTAHQRGIVHRDLTPSNVLLERKETSDPANPSKLETQLDPEASPVSSPSRDTWLNSIPKITDFGLAKQLGASTAQTQSDVVMGTPSYLAPEQASGQSKTAGPATDTYALGAILYEMLAGRPPFRAGTPVETLMQVVADDPVPPRRLQPKVPRDLEIICLKCLQKDPRKRYFTAESLADDLERFLQGKPILARPVPLWEQGWKWAKRRPAWAALGVVSSLAVLSLLLGGLWYGTKLQAAVGEATKSAQEAEEQRLEALANAKKARDAVDHMLTEVAEKHLVQIPETKTMRLALLNKALEFYQNFAKEPGAGWDIRLEKARALHRVGDIIRQLERFSDAATAYQRAIDSFLQLQDEKPEDVDVKKNLANSYNNLGVTYQKMRRREKSEKAHRDALEVRLKLDRDHPGDVGHQANVALSYYNLAIVNRNAKRFDEAEKYYQKTLEINEKLALLHPEDPDRRYAVARVYANKSNCYRDQNRQDDQERSLVKAIEILQGLLDQHRSVAKYGFLMTSCQMNLGNVYSSRWEKAKDERARRLWAEQTEVSYRKAVEHVEPLVRDHPFDPEYQMESIDACFNLGLFYRAIGRGKEAEPLYEKCLVAHKVLALEYPKELRYAAGLGISYSNLANCITANGKPETALALYAEGVRGLEQALVENKTNAKIKKCLRDGLSGWAGALTALNRHDEALRRWDRVLELADPQNRDRIRLRRAATMARRGDHRGAIADAKEINEKKPSLDVLYDKACIYSLASRAVRQDSNLNAEERERLVAQYAARAVSLLTEADQAGFMKSAARRKHVKEDKDLDSIRDREDFKKLLGKWAVKAKAQSK